MSLGAVIALICIIIGFIVGVADASILFDAMTWFVAAIAVVLTLGGVSVGPFVHRRE